MLDNAMATSLWQWLDGRDTVRMNRYRRYLAFYEGENIGENASVGAVVGRTEGDTYETGSGAVAPEPVYRADS